MLFQPFARAVVLAVCVAGGGCLVDIDYGNSNFRCGADGTCPSNLVCVDQRCVEPGGQSDGGVADATVDAPVPVCGDLLCTETCETCTADCGDCVAGSLLYWPFDEYSGTGISDASGGERSGVLTGATRVDSPHGRALEFTGDTSNVMRAGDLDLVSNEVALSAWFRTDDPGERGRELVSYGDIYALRVDDTGLVRFFVRQVDDWVAVEAPQLVDDGQWHHVVGQISQLGGGAGFTLEIYVDGALASSLDVPTGIDYNPLPGRDLLVGQHGAGEVIYPMDGAIDEVRVFARPLALSEITALAQ